MGKGHDVTGRSTLGRRGRDRRVNGPPQDAPWVWMTREMLESPAWVILSGHARKVIDRVMLEHMAHGGAENGRLPVTYDDLVAYGVRRNSIAPAIAETVALGFLDHERGRAAGGSARGHVQLFRLTWLRTADNEPATNRWKSIDSREAARSLAEATRRAGVDGRRRARLQPVPTGKI